MSGGSYDYLCMKSADELFAMEEHLQAMADRLAKLGYAPDAAAETLETLLEIRQARIRIETRRRRLDKIWNAIEWWDSGDCGEESVKQSLAQYRGFKKETAP